MAGFYEDRVFLFRLFTVLHFVGKSFLNLFGFTSVAKKYVCGNKEEFVDGRSRIGWMATTLLSVKQRVY